MRDNNNINLQLNKSSLIFTQNNFPVVSWDIYPSFHFKITQMDDILMMLRIELSKVSYGEQHGGGAVLNSGMRINYNEYSSQFFLPIIRLY